MAKNEGSFLLVEDLFTVEDLCITLLDMIMG